MTETDSPQTNLVGTLLAGRYQILRLLGEGSMGAVYEAEMEGNRRVAIKTLSPSARQALGAEALERFLREAQVSRSVKSDHVVEVIEGSHDQSLDVAFIVMELLEGEDLEQLVHRTGPLEPEIAVRILRQAALGLSAAHEQGIVHRDLKPSNIFLHRRGDEVVVKVCDFGVAKDQSQPQQALTVTGSVLGSPLYMAPEQLLNARKVDWRADIWGLSITSYDALVGVPALNAIESMAMLVVAIARQDIPTLSSAAPWLDPSLSDAIYKGLRRDVAERYQSMAEFAAALQPFNGGSDALTVAMLQGIDPERKARVKFRPGTPTQQATQPPAAATDRGAERYVGTTIAKRYTLERVLQEDADGYVYEARTTSGRRCHIRLVPRARVAALGGASTLIARARRAREVRHPNVLRVLDAGEDPIASVPYIVFEPLEGKSLAQVLREQGPLNGKRAAHIFLHVAHGLSAIHAEGAIHGEVRPSAILLVERDRGERVVLTGWGEARVARDEPSSQPPAGGEPVSAIARYMSPEQARSTKDADPRIDVWGLWLSMYESLAGRQPFGGINVLGDLILAICMREVPLITAFAPSTSNAIAEALRQGLQRNAQKRQGSMDEVMAILAPIAGEPIPQVSEDDDEPIGVDTAQNLSTTTTGSAKRPHPALLVVGALVLVAIVAVVAKALLLS